jgi:membrane protease YdiL (CAAX protease family)
LSAPKAIGLYAVAVVFLGTLFAPWLFRAVQWSAAQIPAVRPLAAYSFRRVFDRSVMVVALLGLWPLLRHLGFRAWRDLGYVRAPGWRTHLLAGFALGLGSLAIAIGISIAVGARTLALDRSAGQIAVGVLRYAAVGIIVALIEETFFRGALQGAFQRGMNGAAAVILASVIYSVMHFLKPKGVNIPPGEVTWNSGFACLAGIGWRLFTDRDVVVSLVTLFLAGCILGLAYAKTRALYLSIGMHAGWVLANESARWLGAGRIIEDVVAWPVLALLLVLVQWLCTVQFKPLGAPRPSASGHGARST